MKEKLLSTEDLKFDLTIEVLKTNHSIKFRVNDMVGVATDESVVNKVNHKRSKGQCHIRAQFPMQRAKDQMGSQVKPATQRMT